jgi:hypothetical protein
MTRFAFFTLLLLFLFFLSSLLGANFLGERWKPLKIKTSAVPLPQFSKKVKPEELKVTRLKNFEPAGTSFSFSEVEFEHPGDDSFQAKLHLRQNWYREYQYSQDVYLQGPSKKKYSFLIEKEKERYRNTENPKIVVQQGEAEAELFIAKTVREYEKWVENWNVLLVSHQWTSSAFGKNNPYFLVQPEELESQLVRLLEFELIILFDRSLHLLEDSQYRLLLDYVRYGGKLLIWGEKENPLSPFKEAFENKEWNVKSLTCNEGSSLKYYFLPYYQGLLFKLVDSDAYSLPFRQKLSKKLLSSITSSPSPPEEKERNTEGKEREIPEILGALLIDNLLLFSPLPPILGPYTFQSYSLRERYFTLIYMICGFLFLLFLSGGPGFILLFRKRKGKQVLFYQIVILGIFSLCSLFFASFIRSLPGDIDTLSFYYLNEEGQGYSVHSHFIGSTQKTIENLKIESSTPFYGLSPLGSPLPSASDYDKGSIALHSFYTKQEELRNFPQNLWGAIPLQVTQPTQRQDGFVVERGELINKTPYLYDKIVLLKIENKNTQPYSIKNRYNSGSQR